MYELSVKSDFASAHFLRGYEGKCKTLHGHTWKVELVIESDKLVKIGMVADFAVVKKQLRDFLEELDHVHLNDLPYFKEINPTTENLAKYIFDEFPKRYGLIRLKRVTVWESDQASITYCK